MDDLALRIRGLKFRQDELSKTRVQVEAVMVARAVEKMDAPVVKSYAKD